MSSKYLSFGRIRLGGRSNGLAWIMGEYKNQEMEEYFRAEGIKAKYTAPCSPEQNGLSERLNLTFMDKVRNLYLMLSRRVWAEAAEKADYLRNLLPTVARSKRSFVSFYSRKPDDSHL
jgi:hypothetical protein